MGISLKTHKMLWGRAAGKCSICRQQLVQDSTETDDESLIGEEAHIVAKNSAGPRGHSSLSQDERDKYENLILLCRNCHKKIDDQPGVYTIEKLNEIKHQHEKREKGRDEFDQEKQKDDEVYATYIEEWEKRIDINNWKNWSSSIISHAQPSIPVEYNNRLDKLREWLLSRVWPQRYEELENAFKNFRLVLQDFCSEFHKHSTKEIGDENTYWTKKFYKIDEWNEERYQRLAREYDEHVDLITELFYELTRAANYVCDMVRKYILTKYRVDEGLLLVTGGPYKDFSFRTFRLEYTKEDKSGVPYKGLDAMRRSISESRN